MWTSITPRNGLLKRSSAQIKSKKSSTSHEIVILYHFLGGSTNSMTWNPPLNPVKRVMDESAHHVHGPFRHSDLRMDLLPDGSVHDFPVTTLMSTLSFE